MKISSERMGNLMSISARVSTYIASNRKKYLRDSDKQEQGKHRGKTKLTETCFSIGVTGSLYTDKERSLNIVPFIIKRTFQTINCEPLCLYK